MRKFRFVGDATNWGWQKNPVNNTVYSLDELAMMNSSIPDVAYIEKRIDTWEDEEWKPIHGIWQEVFDSEEPSKPLHKDTDLGYYTGLAMQSLIELYDHRLEPSRYAKEAIELAKELIKQLDEKTK